MSEWLYLNRGALIGEWTAEECCNNVHHAVRDIILKSDIGVLSVLRCRCNSSHINDEGLFEQRPHVIWSVDFFHLHFRVNVAVIQKIYVRFFYLQIYNNKNQ